MIELALHQPEIPPNTGNLIRLMANIGSVLHVIHPLGFELEDKKLKRAGLDYHEWATVQQHQDDEHFFESVKPRRVIACETNTQTKYSDFQFKPDDIILMGSETRGLPQDLIEKCDAQVYLPMRHNQRSLNLSNAAAIITYEAWRQNGFL